VILDTSAVSAFVEGNLSVREKIAIGPWPYLPVIVIGEYRFGLLGARDRERRLAWLEELIRIKILHNSLASASPADQACKNLSAPVRRLTGITSREQQAQGTRLDWLRVDQCGEGRSIKDECKRRL